MKVYFDGGMRPGAAGMELAVVIAGRSYIQRALGPGSSMDAEWLALIHAVRLVHELGLVDPVLLGDAAAVIAQAKGKARCRGACVAHRDVFTALLPPGRLRIRHIKRTQNLAGIALARGHEMPASSSGVAPVVVR